MTTADENQMTTPTDRHSEDPNAPPATARSAAMVTVDQVKAFLAANPDILLRHPDMLTLIELPSRTGAGNILDLQGFMIKRLQSRVKTLKDIQADLIEASTANSLVRDRVHKATLKLLDARSFEHLIEYIGAPAGLAADLDVAVVALCMETLSQTPPPGLRGIKLAEEGSIQRLLGEGRSYYLSTGIRANRQLYGHRAADLQSEAMVRLDISPVTPPGLLALGSTDPDQFHPDQSSDLLQYLAHIVERCIRLWLDLPPAR